MAMKKLITILISLLITQTALAQDNYEEAARKAAEAYYIQSGVKDNVDRFSKEFERRYVPVIVVQNGGIVMFLVQGIAGDQWKIGYKWEF
jgi:hypothetical protein